eukprot:CAMPEP_0116953928 /NCGR_PEP_ID=MMETSP0467-20121206/41598_1 /TAXON_ID=283647 /ORGANISM="Mesodinium pulex, Strain SPMC105" /LENGTH=147 /DNA_ID=CAMNT_0004639441 /DNA_START=612 /DNA_END=1052 /DNA_ORIENTATION=-
MCVSIPVLVVEGGDLVVRVVVLGEHGLLLYQFLEVIQVGGGVDVVQVAVAVGREGLHRIVLREFIDIVVFIVVILMILVRVLVHVIVIQGLQHFPVCMVHLGIDLVPQKDAGVGVSRGGRFLLEVGCVRVVCVAICRIGLLELIEVV